MANSGLIPPDLSRRILSQAWARFVVVIQTILNFTQFNEALAAANRRFSLIREKYPVLRAYLVLSLRGEQAKVDVALVATIRDLPDLLIDGPPKTKMLDLVKKLKPEEASKAEQIQLNDEIHEISKRLEFAGNVQVELRFHDLNYELIWKLQADDLVDCKLTPQTRASIRVVLGSIYNFAQEVFECGSAEGTG